jgi:hypothetical protein
MGFSTLWTQIKNLLRLPTTLYTYAAAIQGDNDMRQGVIADYWFGRILCSVLLASIYYTTNEVYHMANYYIPPVFDPYAGTINKWGIPFILFICYIVWKIFIEMEFSHATHLAKIPNQLPRFFLLGHSYTKLRQLLKCNVRKYYNNDELEANLNKDSSLQNNNNGSNANNNNNTAGNVANAVNKSKVGISCYWENAWKPVVTISSPDKVNRLMMMNPENSFESRHYCPFRKLAMIDGNSGIMNEDGVYWKTTREQLEKPFNNYIYDPNIKQTCLASIKSEMQINFIDVLNKCSSQMLSSGDVDTTIMINKTIFNTLWNFIFDVDFSKTSENSFEIYHTDNFRDAFIKCLESSTYFNYNNNNKYSISVLSNEFKSQFNKYVAKYENNNTNLHHSNGNMKLMSLANIVLKSESILNYWKRKQTLDNLLTVLVMGYQTITISLKWAMYDLAQNKFYQENIRAKFKAEGQLGHNEKKQENIPSGITYLRACIKESMRLHPPIPYFTRYLLNEVNIGEYVIPAKTMVRVSIYNIHRAINVYGKDADDTTFYNPVDNWITKQHKHVPFSFLPYGGGDRNCIGLHLSQVIIETILSTLISKFEFKTNIDRIYHKFDGYFCKLDTDLKLHFKRV